MPGSISPKFILAAALLNSCWGQSHSALAPAPVPVSPNAQQRNLTKMVRPKYPQKAARYHIQGVVKFMARIDAKGRIVHLRVLSGHPLLVDAALEAVQQWTYRPTFVDGKAVEVVTRIDVRVAPGDGLVQPAPLGMPAARAISSTE